MEYKLHTWFGCFLWYPVQFVCSAGTDWPFFSRLCLIHHPQIHPSSSFLSWPTYSVSSQTLKHFLMGGLSAPSCLWIFYPHAYTIFCSILFHKLLIILCVFFFLLNSEPGQPFSPNMYLFALHWVKFIPWFRGAGTVAHAWLKPRCSLSVWTWDFRNSLRFENISWRRKSKTFHEMCTHGSSLVTAPSGLWPLTFGCCVSDEHLDLWPLSVYFTNRWGGRGGRDRWMEKINYLIDWISIFVHCSWVFSGCEIFSVFFWPTVKGFHTFFTS